MSGRITHLPEAEHPCGLPNPIGLPAMTVWRCDDCHDKWLLIPPTDLAHHPNPSRTWWMRHPGQPEHRPFRWPWKWRNRR